MSKQISQETFNDVVKENIELFEMTIIEAIEDAKKQFDTQKVNLFNIITDAEMFELIDGEVIIKVHPIILKINEIKSMLSENEELSKLQSCIQSLTDFFQLELSYRIMALKNGGFNVLYSSYKYALNENRELLLQTVLISLTAFFNGQPDVVIREFMTELVKSLRSDMLMSHRAQIFRLFNVCCVKHEKNRIVLVDEPNCIIPQSMTFLETYGVESRELVKEISSFCRCLILDDDVRVTCGRGTEHARMMVTDTSCMDTLLHLCKIYKDKDDELIVAEIFATLDKLSVRNEFCQRILDLGGLNYILEAVSNHIQSSRTVVASFGLLKSMAANDRVKAQIGRTDGAELLIRAIRIHMRSVNVCINGFGALAAITLRQIDNSRQLAAFGIGQLICQVLSIHSTGESKNPAVLRPACLTIRNMVARSPELKPVFLESGIEAVLNEVLQLGRECDDEAKAALRDLGCAVHLREPWTGKHGTIAQ